MLLKPHLIPGHLLGFPVFPSLPEHPNLWHIPEIIILLTPFSVVVNQATHLRPVWDPLVPVRYAQEAPGHGSVAARDACVDVAPERSESSSAEGQCLETLTLEVGGPEGKSKNTMGKL